MQDTLERIITKKGLPHALLENPDFAEVISSFSRTYCLDFNPTSSVLGAIVSQEIVKVVTQRDFPSHGLAVYDAVTQRCVFE
jgi:hypothetical protein